MTRILNDAEFRTIRIIVISSVLPSNTSAGHVLLHRHLVNRKEIVLEICENRQSKWSVASCRRRIASALSSAAPRTAQSLMLSANGNWYTSPTYVPSDQPTVVLTVAHGDLFLPAMRYAREHGLPLVTFFHDWWPDIANVTASQRATIERQFRDLYQQSSLALCVSQGMKNELGDHPNSHVLLPLPQQQELKIHDARSQNSKILKVVYAGNLHQYGPMLESLMRSAKEYQILKLEVRGGNPDWTEDFKEEMRANGMWLPLAYGSEFDDWNASADVFLVPQSFDSADQRMMATNFPSKLPEMAKWGRPLVLWGPQYASALRWNQDGHALGITDSDPNAVIQELLRIHKDAEVYEELCRGARHVAQNEFDPDGVQLQFLRLMNSLRSHAV